MANRTVKDAESIHGTNPQYIIEKIIRTRIYDSKYWKESCFALTGELLVDKAMDLKFAGGVFGSNTSPTPFLCLILKMLQIQPEKDIVIEFIKQDDYKYVRLLGAFYLRLVYPSLDCYKYLEPLINDYRKIRLMSSQGAYFLSHVDEIIDRLMREERVFDVILPRIQKRWVHENNGELEPRVSLLEDDLDEIELEDSEDEAAVSPVASPRHRNDHHNSSSHRDRHSPDRRRGRDKQRRQRSRSKERRLDTDRDRRKRSRSKDRRQSDRHHRHRDYMRDSRQDNRDRLPESREHRRRDERREDRSHHKDKERKRHRRERREEEDPDIAEANAIRAKLGMAPLRM